MEDKELKERIEKLKQMRANPCGDGEHTYADQVFSPDNLSGTMLTSVCTKCLDMQGWIYR